MTSPAPRLGAVDLALCLSVDCSSSVDFDEFGLMLSGYGAAFAVPAIAEAIGLGRHGAIGLAMLHWSGPGARDVALPWVRVEPADAPAIGRRIAELPRLVPPGATALGEGMAGGLALLAAFPGEATRLALDVSGDGRNNAGRPPGPVRDLAVAAGVTVNALAVVDEEPDLLAYYLAEVVGGPGAFALEAASYLDFEEAIARKLLREIRPAAASS
ncbi:MAG: DUF1194 domain-containing protein [Acetobacteraceae bacterium]|nr:DUF1194 domain-containing protein [Acetobacteraceae bacterium]